VFQRLGYRFHIIRNAIAVVVLYLDCIFTRQGIKDAEVLGIHITHRTA